MPPPKSFTQEWLCVWFNSTNQKEDEFWLTRAAFENDRRVMRADDDYEVLLDAQGLVVAIDLGILNGGLIFYIHESRLE